MADISLGIDWSDPDNLKLLDAKFVPGKGKTIVFNGWEPRQKKPNTSRFLLEGRGG